MEPSSKLAEITLVTKYYPVANYSYPRKDIYTRHDGRNPNERTSVGSEASAPGLVEDKSDSDASGDEEHHYHTHGSELWDNYWQGGYAARKNNDCSVHPRKQYPALIPSPRQRRPQCRDGIIDKPPAWPLPSLDNTSRSRKPASTYSAFPRPTPAPSKPRPAPSSPSWTTSKSKQRPERPPRPDDELLTPCIPQVSPVRATFGTDETNYARPWSPNYGRPVSPNDGYVPANWQHPRPASPEKPTIICPAANCSADDLAILPVVRPSRLARIPAKSTPHFRSTPSPLPAPILRSHLHPSHQPQVNSAPLPQPQSVFEDDSDSESNGRSFFRFHKRAHSDDRRANKASDEKERKNRNRSSTVPPSSRDTESPDPERTRKKDLFGKVLGRRSR